MFGVELTEAQERAVVEAQRMLEIGAREAEADNPGFEAEAAWSDLVEATCWDLEDTVARELCRRELGWIPSGLEARLGRKDWIE